MIHDESHKFGSRKPWTMWTKVHLILSRIVIVVFFYNEHIVVWERKRSPSCERFGLQKW